MNKDIQYWREGIDNIDNDLILLLNYRFDYCKEIGKIKESQGNKSIEDANREREIIDNLKLYEKHPGLVEKIWPVIMEYSKELQEENK